MPAEEAISKAMKDDMISVSRSDFPEFIRDRIYWGFVDMEPMRDYWSAWSVMPLALPRQSMAIKRYDRTSDKQDQR